MFLGRVIGSLQSTAKLPGLTGIKLMLVQPTKSDGSDDGDAIVATDATQSGPGDTVYLCNGREASLAFVDTFIATDASIVAIVDQVSR